MSEAVRCYLCRSDDTRTIDDRVRDRRRIRNVQCQRCGAMYLNPRASEAEYAAFYQDGFSLEFNKFQGTEDPHALAAAAQPKTDRTLRFLGPSIKPGMRVLEIGCGYGNFLAAMRDRFHASEVCGIEPDPQGARVANAVYQLDVQTKTFAEFLAQYEGAPFDVIIMYHVLEHFLDPNDVGVALSRLLKKDGVIFIGVPEGSHPPYPKSMFYRFPHTVTFTPYTLALFLWRYGFKVTRRDPHPMHIGVVAVHRTSGDAALPWNALIDQSLPPDRVARRIWWLNIWHTFRLASRRWKAALPSPLKRVLKRIIR